MNLKRLSECRYIIEDEKDQKVPAIIFGNKNTIMDDNSLNQLVNISKLEGIVYAALGMPDIHEGYGFPIGGVAGFDINEGIISPGGVGYDINCGVRLLTTDYDYTLLDEEIKDSLLRALYRDIPAGLGSRTSNKWSKKELKKVMEEGLEWAYKEGFALWQDIDKCESRGRLSGADSKAVSKEAYKRGEDELGTLGSGNHFLEVQFVEKVFNKEISNIFNLYEGKIVIMIHTGSRGLGHQIASDYMKEATKYLSAKGISTPDKELVYFHFNTSYGKKYWNAMACAANYAWVNRQIITYQVRKIFERILGISDMPLLYDVAHNIAKIEHHTINGEKRTLIVHRKGATRSFPKGHKELPEIYKEIGQPVLLPGDMGRSSYVMIGTEESMNISLGSVSHGAGRVMSRRQARKNIESKDVINDLESKGIKIMSHTKKGIVEEASQVYKDVEDIVGVLECNNLAISVARLKPLMVIKG